jgi:hypothetical protein
MGAESSCRIEVDGVEAAAKVLLETDELIVRGAMRLKIPFRHVKEATVADGTLRIRWDDHRASFDLGAQAAKWAEKILNPKSVIDKIGVKSGQTVSIAGEIDPQFIEQMKSRGAVVAKRPQKQSDILFFGVRSRSQLVRLRKLRELLTPSGALWVVRPKRTAAISDADVIAAGKKAGLVDVKVVRFSVTHSAEKLVIPLAKR